MTNQAVLERKEPQLEREISRLGKALDELSSIIQEIRSVLDIPEPEEVNKSPEVLPRIPQHRVEVRGEEIANLTAQVNYQIHRLGPIMEVVKEI